MSKTKAQTPVVQTPVKEKRETPAKRLKRGFNEFVELTQKKEGEFLTALSLQMEPGDIVVGELVSIELVESRDTVTDDKGKTSEVTREYPVFHIKECSQEYYDGSGERGNLAMSGGVNLQEQMKKVSIGDTIAILYEGKVKTAKKRKVNVYRVSVLNKV